MEKLTIKRLNNELKKLANEPLEYIDTYVDPDNLFTFYFLVKGPRDSDYSEGYYIGKIMVSPGYPKTPVDFMMLTPNGRFEANSKICLTNSGYHADQWTPMWDMTSMLHAFLSIMLADDTSGISHIRRSSEERKLLAQQSFNYNIANNADIFAKFTRFIEVNDGHFKPRDNSVKNNQTSDEKQEKTLNKDNEKPIVETEKTVVEIEKVTEIIDAKEPEVEKMNEVNIPLKRIKKKPVNKAKLIAVDHDQDEDEDEENNEKPGKKTSASKAKKKTVIKSDDEEENEPVKKIVHKKVAQKKIAYNSDEEEPKKKSVQKKIVHNSDDEKPKKIVHKKVAQKKIIDKK